MESKNKKSLFMSIVGRPNVGKSSILNMLLGSKISIVSPKPQTTRNKITGILTLDDTQLVFLDTPGIHKPHTRLGGYMINQINDSFCGAESIMHVIDAEKGLRDEDLKFIKRFKDMNLPVVLVINKIDLLKDKSMIMNLIQDAVELFSYTAVVPISAINSDGRRELISEIVKLAKPSVFFFAEDDITDQSERTIVSEIIREKMLYLLDKEIPHGVAISIEKFHESKNEILNIDAVINCERNNHKAIIIGHKGNMIKKIGTESRKELERIFDVKINLQLWVKVKENWRNRASNLKDFGYILEKN